MARLQPIQRRSRAIRSRCRSDRISTHCPQRSIGGVPIAADHDAPHAADIVAAVVKRSGSVVLWP